MQVHHADFIAPLHGFIEGLVFGSLVVVPKVLFLHSSGLSKIFRLLKSLKEVVVLLDFFGYFGGPLKLADVSLELCNLAIFILKLSFQLVYLPVQIFNHVVS